MHIHNGAEVSQVDTEPQNIDLPTSSPPAPIQEASSNPPEPAPADEPEAQPAAPAASSVSGGLQAPISVIGADLTISGQDVHVISKGKIRVEGKIQGDVLGTDVVIGDVGTVEGVVAGDSVKVFGVILGTIRGVQVEIEAGAKVEADIHHHSLSVNPRAQIDGRVCRVGDKAALKAAEETEDTRESHDGPSAAVQTPQQSSAAHPRKGRLWR